MKRFLLIFLGSILVSPIFSQGINFVHDLDEALTKAKVADKMVFVDFYTSWCGPCKRLSKEVFPTKEAGDFFNKHFINCKVQCDEEGVGAELGKKYGVRAYPTLMFLNQKGEIVHTRAGASDVKNLIDLAKIALDPEKNLLAITTKWENGHQDLDFASVYFEELKKAYLMTKLKADFEKYFAALNMADKHSAKAFELVKKVKVFPFSPTLNYLEENKTAYIEHIPVNEFDDFISRTYFAFFKKMARNDSKEVYDNAIQKFKTKDYPFEDEYVMFFNVLTAKDENGHYNILEFQKSGTKFLEKYGVNDDNYTISLTQQLGKCIKGKDEGLAGVEWMDTLLARNRDPKYLKTYLYILQRNHQFGKALEVAEEMRDHALANELSTIRIDKQIEQLKASI